MLNYEYYPGCAKKILDRKSNDVKQEVSVMSERKYESDMTKKEKRKLRKEQLLSTHGKDRIDYIWSYYKLEIFFGIIIVVVCAIIINSLWHMRYKQILYVGVVNAEDCDGEKMAADFREFIDNDNKFDMVDVDTSITIDPDSDLNDFYGTFRFTTYTSTSIMDVAIMDKDVFELYKDSGAFEPLADYLTEEDNAGLSFTDVSVVDQTALDLTGNEKLASYGIDTSKPVYLIVSGQSENEEYVKQYIRFLFSEN